MTCACLGFELGQGPKCRIAITHGRGECCSVIVAPVAPRDIVPRTIQVAGVLERSVELQRRAYLTGIVIANRRAGADEGSSAVQHMPALFLEGCSLDRLVIH